MPSSSRRMFSKPKNWLSGSIWKPKNPHSLEHLKFLYNLLCKNQTVTEQNRGLLVETLRSISEILIWGDQNDSSVFDFFLEKNMLSFFLRYLQQKFGRFICIQLLQTLNILFENISNETSLYYLLSNNHINSIIVHKFDFSDEEVMAYYISFLKTLSLKLNKHTIHFFYNEHTNDFALYTEAIKFFNHSETMVRIAVRTITLNVFKVDDKAMLSYIRNRTAAPYFSNLVWFIGNHILDLDACVRHDHDHRSRDRLADLVAEHLDHLHYLNDIFLIDIHTLNEVLTDKLLNRLLVPLYVYSLTKRKKFSEDVDDRKHVSCVVSLFLLSQVFLIIRYGPLMQQLADVIFKGDVALAQPSGHGLMNASNVGIREFRPPRESLEKTLENTRPHHRNEYLSDNTESSVEEQPSLSAVAAAAAEVLSSPSTEGARSPASEVCSGDTELSSPTQNSTDEEKLMGRTHHRLIRAVGGSENPQTSFSLDNRPYLESIFNALECSENDYSALFALCLLYAIGRSNGISQALLDSVLMPTERSSSKEHYNLFLVERLIRIIELACQSGNRVRLATLEMSIKVLKQLVDSEDRSYLQDRHLACIENARECCTQLLRNFYKSEEIFLDMFEDEFREMRTRPMNVEYLMQDASILLPPTGTPLTGIDFNKRLPCGEVERARRAIRAFFLVRDLSLSLLHEPETQLPLTKEDVCIKTNDVLDLNNSDLIACTVTRERERRNERRFLVIDPVQLILVEPDSKRLGWGVVKFVGYLQDVEVSGDKDDSRLLHVVVHKPQSSIHAKPVPILSAKFVFDDHIRCMAAKQRLIKGRQRARQQKMNTIERLLDITSDTERGHFTRSGPIPGRSHPVRVDSTKSLPISIPVSSSPLTPVSSSSTLPPSNVTPASRSGRRVTPEQRKLLQAKAAQRSKSKQNQVAQQSGGTSGKGSSSRDSQGCDEANKPDSAACSESKSETSFASAVQSLNSRPSSGPAVPSGIGKLHAKGGDISNNSQSEIPLEDLSHKIRGRACSGDRMTAIAIPPRERYRFQRSLSHSPNRAPKHPNTVTLIYAEKKESGRRLSAPVMLSSSRHIPVPVTKVSTATQVGRPHSHSTPEPGSVVGKVEPLRKRFLSGPSPATLRAADTPTTSLLESSLSPAIPKLLPPNDIEKESFGSDESGIHSSSSSFIPVMSGARPKQPIMGPNMAKGATKALNSSSSVSMRIQELSLQGLQISAEKDTRKGGKDGGNAISPETPSSDSAVSSDASMISVSSMASESSMDVDSDNNAASVAAAAAAFRGKPASASQQLTQLAQMVQEHYPYGAADPKKHTG